MLACTQAGLQAPAGMDAEAEATAKRRSPSEEAARRYVSLSQIRDCLADQTNQVPTACTAPCWFSDWLT